MLGTLILNNAVPGSARVEALHIYSSRKPAGLDEMIAKLAIGQNDHLAIGALQQMASSSPQAVLEALTKATTSGSAYRMQQAWKIAAGIPGAEELFVSSLADLQEQNGVSPAALELLDAAGKRSEPNVKAALAAFEASRAKSTDPLAAWLPSLEGGDPAQGAKVFESHPAAQCMRCHSGGHGGGDAGPNLSDIATREEPRYFLESLVNPGAKVAMGYGIASATLKGGKTVSGIVVEDKPDHVDFDSADTVLRVNRADIASMTPPVSSMPPMAFLLSKSEIRDLVAWLSEQKSEPARKKPRPAPVLVKP
jgi:quinoprotein glucose dehydrogenase